MRRTASFAAICHIQESHVLVHVEINKAPHGVSNCLLHQCNNGAPCAGALMTRFPAHADAVQLSPYIIVDTPF